jgi:two-component system nitrogen regulation sensor histidine kinase NtrY
MKVRLSHEYRVSLFALAGGIPALAAALILIFRAGWGAREEWTLAVVLVGAWLAFTLAVKERVASPLRTLASLLEAMREGDYSIRARVDNPHQPMGEVMQQVNAMAATAPWKLRRCCAR